MLLLYALQASEAAIDNVEFNSNTKSCALHFSFLGDHTPLLSENRRNRLISRARAQTEIS